MKTGTKLRNEADFASKNQPVARVAILLCTYQGQQYLADQLDSFAGQTHSNWVVWASDDGSQDDTRAILESYSTKWGNERLSVHAGPGQGSTANFISLTCNADTEADFYAYADQDDIWEPDKLQRAVEWLGALPDNAPGLYCTRTRLVDADNHEIGFSPLFKNPPGFANALVQNVGGGNTMVFNNAARTLLRNVGKDTGMVIHDWWAYLVVSGCGGRIRYDPYPSVRYRQHGGNLVGGNSSWSDRLARIRAYRIGQFKQWNDHHIRALEKIREKLTPSSRNILDQFSHARKDWLLPRLFGIKRSGVYRQTLFGNLALFVASVFGKI